MPSLKETKRRIVSVKNTQKITRAMKLVSSAKYARSNKALMGAEPYYQSVNDMMAVAETDRLDEMSLFGNAQERAKSKKALVIIISTDRGLCGGLNTNLFKFCNQILDAKKQADVFELALWGKRSVLFGQKRREKVVEKREKVLDKPSYSLAKEEAQKLIDSYREQGGLNVYLVFNKFKNAMTQTPVIQQILPVLHEEQNNKVKVNSGLTIMEPERAHLLNLLAEKKVAADLYNAVLHSAASEHAARMTAMDSATSNADQVIRNLTLEYNRARQAAITKELIEITSGAEAL